MKLIEERTLFENSWYPEASFFRDGSVLLIVNNHADWNEPGSVKLSQDGCRTWQAIQLKDIMGFYQLKDGSLMGFAAFNQIQDKLRAEQEYAPFIARIRTAKSPQDLVAGRYEDDFVKITIPNLGSGCGDDNNVYTGCIWRGLVETERGDLIMTMYGRFRSDLTKVPYFDNTYQARSWTCLSRDRGRTWHYLSTVAAGDRNPLPVLAEGYCEPDQIALPDGGLLAVMRTGSNPSPKGDFERYTPLVATRSPDFGITWGPLQEIAPYGANPRLLRMKSGMIVCLAGRPGFFLVTSRDEGVTWSEPLVITDDHRQFGQCSSGYGSIAEMEPGVLTVIYDESREADGKRVCDIKLRRYAE